MANFAVLDGINVINTIIAESKAVAEEVTGKTCVAFTETDNAEAGGTYENKKFIPKKPFASWVLNADNVWEAPVEHPTDGKSYLWDEPTTSWVEVQ